MKYIIVLFCSLLFSCNSEKKELSVIEPETKTPQRFINQDFIKILMNNSVTGTILFFDEKENIFHSNDFDEAEKANLPASTFKIPNSIIGLETQILQDENTIFEYDGEVRRMEIWEDDLTLRDAFQRSCVPCYQELARKIGTDRMQQHLDSLKFGEMEVHDENLDTFWLVGNSKISPFEQIDFLKRFYNAELPISEQTTKTMKKVMILEANAAYTLRGKTGLSVGDEVDLGWFVGFVEKDNHVYYFATKIRPKENLTRNEFMELRKSVTMEALKQLHILTT